MGISSARVSEGELGNGTVAKMLSPQAKGHRQLRSGFAQTAATATLLERVSIIQRTSTGMLAPMEWLKNAPVGPRRG